MSSQANFLSFVADLGQFIVTSPLWLEQHPSVKSVEEKKASELTDGVIAFFTGKVFHMGLLMPTASKEKLLMLHNWPHKEGSTVRLELASTYLPIDDATPVWEVTFKNYPTQADFQARWDEALKWQYHPVKSNCETLINFLINGEQKSFSVERGIQAVTSVVTGVQRKLTKG
jgi:hypothetical protein